MFCGKVSGIRAVSRTARKRTQELVWFGNKVPLRDGTRWMSHYDDWETVEGVTSVEGCRS